MRFWLKALHAIALLAAAAAIPAAAADETLKICLDEDLPPLSLHHRGKPDSGFDVALAQAVAAKLGRPLKVQWFESKLDEDSARHSKPTHCSPMAAARWSAVMP